MGIAESILSYAEGLNPFYVGIATQRAAGNRTRSDFNHAEGNEGSGVFSLAIGTKLLRGKTLVVNFQTKQVTVR